jgi:peptidoglycan/xylan/chitin deacetylase (PgdA/CDA1 family)
MMTGFGAAKRIAGRFRTRLVDRRLILMYHRVTRVECDYWRLCVTPEKFSEHLQVLQEYGACMTVAQMVRLLKIGRLPRRAVAVTFDDGYADNLLEAKPLLERYDVPATFFLCPGLLDGSREFWWDELEHIILHPIRLPPDLRLNIEGKSFEYHMTSGVELTVENRRRHHGWHYLKPPPTERHALYLAVWKVLWPLRHSQRRVWLDQLAVWSRVSVKPRMSHRPLSAAEVVSLARSTLVEIGAHTVTHSSLPAQRPEIQRAEIFQSKAACETLCGREVTSFSYPFGDSVPATANLVRDAGFTSACTIGVAPITRGTNCFQLPRLAIKNWDGTELEWRLGSPLNRWNSATDV